MIRVCHAYASLIRSLQIGRSEGRKTCIDRDPEDAQVCLDPPAGLHASALCAGCKTVQQAGYPPMSSFIGYPFPAFDAHPACASHNAPDAVASSEPYKTSARHKRTTTHSAMAAAPLPTGPWAMLNQMLEVRFDPARIAASAFDNPTPIASPSGADQHPPGPANYIGPLVAAQHALLSPEPEVRRSCVDHFTRGVGASVYGTPTGPPAAGAIPLIEAALRTAVFCGDPGLVVRLLEILQSHAETKPADILLQLILGSALHERKWGPGTPTEQSCGSTIGAILQTDLGKILAERAVVSGLDDRLLTRMCLRGCAPATEADVICGLAPYTPPAVRLFNVRHVGMIIMFASRPGGEALCALVLFLLRAGLSDPPREPSALRMEQSAAMLLSVAEGGASRAHWAIHHACLLGAAFRASGTSTPFPRAELGNLLRAAYLMFWSCLRDAPPGGHALHQPCMSDDTSLQCRHVVGTTRHTAYLQALPLCAHSYPTVDRATTFGFSEALRARSSHPLQCIFLGGMSTATGAGGVLAGVARIDAAALDVLTRTPRPVRASISDAVAPALKGIIPLLAVAAQRRPPTVVPRDDAPEATGDMAPVQHGIASPRSVVDSAYWALCEGAVAAEPLQELEPQFLNIETAQLFRWPLKHTQLQLLVRPAPTRLRPAPPTAEPSIMGGEVTEATPTIGLLRVRQGDARKFEGVALLASMLIATVRHTLGKNADAAADPNGTWARQAHREASGTLMYCVASDIAAQYVSAVVTAKPENIAPRGSRNGSNDKAHMFVRICRQLPPELTHVIAGFAATDCAQGAQRRTWNLTERSIRTTNSIPCHAGLLAALIPRCSRALQHPPAGNAAWFVSHPPLRLFGAMSEGSVQAALCTAHLAETVIDARGRVQTVLLPAAAPEAAILFYNNATKGAA